MSVLCSALLALGLSLNGTCSDVPDDKAHMQLPKEDPAVWDYKLPVKPEPKPKAPPAMPPIVIERTITKEVHVPAPVAAPVEKPKREAPKPDPYRVWMEAMQNQTTQASYTQEKWAEVDVTPAQNASTELDGLAAPSLASLSASKKDKAKYDFENKESTKAVDNERKLTIDRYITGTFEGGINSQLSSKEGGDIVIQVSRDIFAYGIRNLLIPKGSRMNCGYESPKGLNATRIPLKCYRILLAGDKKGQRVEISELAAPVGDAQGRAGVTGEVNNHFAKQYGTAIMLSLISSGVRGSSAMLSGKDGKSSTTADIADAASQELGTRFGEISASVLEKTTNLVPTITIAQGTRVQIRLRKDWYLKEIK